jgi:protein TonB
VTVQVAVGADGRATSVTVVSDPGHGFGREARMCAMRETYTAAADHDGNPIAGQTKAFRIHFER